MAEQVEKGLSQEAVELAGADVAEDLEAAGNGFASRVVAGLKRHLSGYGDAVEKAAADNKCGIRVDVQEKKADKVDEAPGSSPGQALGGAIRAMSQKKD